MACFLSWPGGTGLSLAALYFAWWVLLFSHTRGVTLYTITLGVRAIEIFEGKLLTVVHVPLLL